MLPHLFIHSRLNLIRKTVYIALIAGIVLSYNLWLSDRLFPLAPVFGLLPPLPSPIDGIMVTLLLFLLLNSTYKPKKLLNHLILLVLFFLCLQDQNRWQPWVYLYVLFLLPFSLFHSESIAPERLINYFRLILVAVYIWSGIHKLHQSFTEETFQSILTQFLRFRDPETLAFLKPFGYSLGIIEILTGIVLFLPKIRQAGVWLAAFMHVFILLYLSPLGINHNLVVFPWNMAMLALVFLCFYNIKDRPVIWFENNLKLSVLTGAVFILTWLLPALNFFGLWDHYASFALYSNKVSEFYIIIGESEIGKIDARLKPYFKNSEAVNGGEIIDMNAWSLGELNVPVYPESRVFKQVSQSFCNLNIAEGQLFFLEMLPPKNSGKINRFTCAELTIVQ